MSFEDLKQRFHLQPSDIVKYELLCNSILDSFPNGFPSIVSSDLEVYVQIIASSSHVVSLLYKKLNHSDGGNINFLSSFWNAELDLSLSLDTWKKIWLNYVSGWLPVSLYQTKSFMFFNCLWTPLKLYNAKLLNSSTC